MELAIRLCSVELECNADGLRAARWVEMTTGWMTERVRGRVLRQLHGSLTGGEDESVSQTKAIGSRGGGPSGFEGGVSETICCLSWGNPLKWSSAPVDRSGGGMWASLDCVLGREVWWALLMRSRPRIQLPALLSPVLPTL